MKSFILTGAPGSGKTAVIRQLELDGFAVVEEAATDVIALEQVRGNAEPWKTASFLDAVARLQRLRQLHRPGQPCDMQFHDRSVFCTVALASYLGYPATPLLCGEVKRITDAGVFQKQVFFLENLGFITPTEARRISFEETLRFERIHETTYREYGFDVVPVKAAGVEERAAVIEKLARSFLSPS